MSWQEGDLIDVEVGDGQGHVVLPYTWFVWCRPVATGTATVMQWRTDEPVPSEGTRVDAEYRQLRQERGWSQRCRALLGGLLRSYHRAAA